MVSQTLRINDSSVNSFLALSVSVVRFVYFGHDFSVSCFGRVVPTSKYSHLSMKVSSGKGRGICFSMFGFSPLPT
ncbi:MAG: hypothetical protein EBS60_06515 [Verrucomicrobia bacterium]|nr:hypothetical protein [Verrucomicrobiota bacterium]